MNPFVFIVGCPRSGTTLLRRMVDAHPEIAIPRGETHWIAKWFEKRRGITSEGFITPELLRGLLAYEKFARMGIGREDLEALVHRDGPLPYSSFVSGIFDLYGKAQGKRLVGDKTPDYVRSVPTLHALWPKARFVHLIRDGRDVCLSMMGWSRVDRSAGRFATWTVDPVSTLALYWKWNVGLGREAGSSLGPELYHEVRYEALVADPAEECAKLCDFLGVPYDDAMPAFHEGRTRVEPGLDAKRAWLPVTGGLRDWRSQMPAEHVERFEAAASELLDELGYSRAFPNPPPRSERRAAELQASFAREVRSRTRFPLPEGW
jgi:hypothetical protein